MAPGARCMTLLAVHITLVGGCRYGFGHGDLGAGDGADARVPILGDAMGALDAPATPFDAAMPTTQPGDFCPVTPDLVGCFTFSGNTDDGSMYGNHATASNTSFEPGIAGMALRTDTSSVVTIDDHPSLQYPPDAVTMEAWVRADIVPQSGRVGVLDQNGGPSIFIYDNGDVRCFAGQRRVETGPGWVPQGQWVHLACTYDTDTTTIYIDGQPALVQGGGSAISPGNIGISIAGNSPSGDPFTGLIDSVRIWRVARSQADICAAAGASCP